MLCAAALALLPGASPAEEDAGKEADGWPCAVAEHWREVAYVAVPQMSRYHKYRGCVAWTAWQFELPEELLYAILYVERGDIDGHCRRNRNGTHDCGPAQINDMRLGEIKRFNLTKKLIRSSPCHNIWAMGYLLRREIEKAGGSLWRGTGNYHYQYSASRSIHGKYVARVRAAWERLTADMQRRCGSGG